MTYSISTGLGNGTNRLFPVTFPYIDKSHVHVYVAGVETSAFTWFNDSTIQLNSAPANGAIVRIQRDTPKSTTAVDFTTGSMLKESTLDLNSEALLYIVQEGFDTLAESIGPDASLAKWDAEGKPLVNLADSAEDSAAVTNQRYNTVMLPAMQAIQTATQTLHDQTATIESQVQALYDATSALKVAVDAAQADVGSMKDSASASATSAASALSQALAAATAAEASAAEAAEAVASGVPDATTSVKGKVLLAASGGTTAGTVVQASDSRLSDNRLLKAATSLASGTDYNTLTTIGGIWLVQPSTSNTNGPGSYLTDRYIVVNVSYSTIWCVQLAMRMCGTTVTPELWMRSYYNGTFGPWLLVGGGATYTGTTATDYNTLTIPNGMWWITANAGNTNGPGSFQTAPYLLRNISYTSTYLIQLAYRGNSTAPEMWMRNCAGGTWGSWIRVDNEALATGNPTGSVIATASETVPTGYLECNGAAVSRTTYAGLYAAIGVIHGSGDGSTTFNLPDYRGRFLRGWDHAASRDPDKASRTAMATGGQTGDHVGSVQTDAFKSHTHDIPNYDTGSGITDVALTSGITNNHGGTPPYTFPTAAYGGNETRPVNAGVMFCIKY